MIRLQRQESGPYRGPGNTYVIDALLPKMGPGKARGAQFGYSKQATRNTAWPLFGGNPMGRCPLWRDPALQLARVG
jgi:hypothetical protein